jgi:hypothetical protein
MGYEYAAKIPLKQKADVIPFEAIFNLFNSYQEPEVKCLFAITYLTGCRISEALQLKRKDFRDEIVKNQNVTVVHLINLKNRIDPFKDIPLIAANDKDKIMIDYVLAYKNKIASEMKLFKISRFVAHHKFVRQKVFTKLVSWIARCPECDQQLIKLATGEHRCLAHGIIDEKKIKYDRHDVEGWYNFNPHFNRHCRLTHLSEAGFDVTDLMAVAGWLTPKQSATYVRKRWRRTAEKMLK